jgi:hypothetical protein
MLLESIFRIKFADIPGVDVVFEDFVYCRIQFELLRLGDNSFSQLSSVWVGVLAVLFTRCDVGVSIDIITIIIIIDIGVVVNRIPVIRYFTRIFY